MQTRKRNNKNMLTPIPLKNTNNSILHDLGDFSDLDLNNLGEESRIIVSLLTKRFDALEAKLEAKESRITQLEQEVCTLKISVSDLADQLDEVRSIGNVGEMIISGNSLPPCVLEENTTGVVCDLIKRELKYSLEPANICTSFRFGRKSPLQGPDRRSIRLKVIRPDVADDLLRSCKTVKPPGLYINEWLTPVRSRVLATLKQAKKRFPEIVSACGSRSGRVYVWIKSGSPNGKNSKIFIDSERKLGEFTQKAFDLLPSDIFQSGSNVQS